MERNHNFTDELKTLQHSICPVSFEDRGLGYYKETGIIPNAHI